MLQLVVPDYQTHRIGFEPKDERAQRAVRGTGWKDETPKHYQELKLALRTIATKPGREAALCRRRRTFGWRLTVGFARSQHSPALEWQRKIPENTSLRSNASAGGTPAGRLSCDLTHSLFDILRGP